MPWSNLSIQNLILENEVEKQEQRRVKLHDLLWDCMSLSDPSNPALRKQGVGGQGRIPGLGAAPRRDVVLTYLPAQEAGQRPSGLACVFVSCVVCELDVKKIPVWSKII